MQHHKTMAIGQGMALAGILQLAVLSQSASADAYRCKRRAILQPKPTRSAATPMTRSHETVSTPA